MIPLAQLTDDELAALADVVQAALAWRKVQAATDEKVEVTFSDGSTDGTGFLND